MTAENRRRVTNSLIASAILGQLFSFATKCFNQIDNHGTAYTGIARHLRQEKFHAHVSACSLGDGSASSRGTLRLPADVQNAKDVIATWSVSNVAINGPGSFAVPQLMTSRQV